MQRRMGAYTGTADGTTGGEGRVVERSIGRVVAGGGELVVGKEGWRGGCFFAGGVHYCFWRGDTLAAAAARVALSAGVSSYFTALASSSFCQNLTTISHLCSAGRQLLRGLHGFVPSGII